MKQMLPTVSFSGECQSHGLVLKSSVRKHNGYVQLSCTHLNLPWEETILDTWGNTANVHRAAVPTLAGAAGARVRSRLPRVNKRIVLGAESLLHPVFVKIH